MLTKFLNPKNDAAFKKIFGTHQNQEILIHFLNDMLVFKEGNPITSIVFLKTVQDPDVASRKTSIVDVLCADAVGNQYIVEMQVAEREDFVKRAQYYAAKAYSSQLNMAGEYGSLREIIFLAITNFIMFPNKKEYKSDHIVLDKYTYEHDLKDFSFTFLELPKFNKTKTELSSMIDKWAFFFKYAEETITADLKEIIGDDIIIKKAYEELCKFNWSEEELFVYEAVLKRDLDYNGMLAFDLAKNKAKAHAEVYAEIHAEGYDQGMVEGKAEGKAEGELHLALNIAIKMLQKDMLIEEIADITGLSIHEINKLRAESITSS